MAAVLSVSMLAALLAIFGVGIVSRTSSRSDSGCSDEQEELDAIIED